MAGQQDTEHKLREGLEKARSEMKENASASGETSSDGAKTNERPGVDDTASRSGDPAVPDRTQG